MNKEYAQVAERRIRSELEAGYVVADTPENTRRYTLSRAVPSRGGSVAPRCLWFSPENRTADGQRPRLAA